MATKPIILRVAVASPLRFPLDYLPPDCTEGQDLQPGMRIQVPFRSGKTTGVLIETIRTSDLKPERLRKALHFLEPYPLFSPTHMELLRFVSDYYHEPIGEVYAAALPKLLRSDRNIDVSTHAPVRQDWSPELPPVLNAEQAIAVEAIIAALGGFRAILLDGVTGSGKTEVYFRAIEAVVRRGQQALVLVPEIALTPQTVARFTRRFSEHIVTYHSNLTETERRRAWLAAQRGDADIIIGTRSAVFLPIQRLGIVIVDEEHDSSYKQQEGLRYHGRDVAVMRAKFEGVPVLLGSATPSLESRYNVQNQRYQSLLLPNRAGPATMPRYRLIDIRNQRLDRGLSVPVIEAMREHLARGEQVLLFLNRRGYSPHVVCHECGTVVQCPHCDVKLIMHKDPNLLICHHCGFSCPQLHSCPHCQGRQIVPLGLGTERIEDVLGQHFPEHSCIRIDRDSTRQKGSMAQKLEDIHEGRSQILIGTQMLAKGHHFPNVTLVAIIDADSGLLSSELQATERMGQLLVQVAGRAGRATRPGTVLIQTRQPTHPLINTLLRDGYGAFAEAVLQERRQAQLPPFSYLALFRTQDKNKDLAIGLLTQVQAHCLEWLPAEMSLLGPIPAPLARKANRYHALLLLQANNRRCLQQTVGRIITHIETSKLGRKVQWSIDIDPIEMS